jgi:hypothetical protein
MMYRIHSNTLETLVCCLIARFTVHAYLEDLAGVTEARPLRVRGACMSLYSVAWVWSCVWIWVVA